MKKKQKNQINRNTKYNGIFINNVCTYCVFINYI